MIKFSGLSHININVDNMDNAIQYYEKLFNAKPIQTFPHFKNSGFAKSAGFMKNPEDVNVSITFLQIPNTSITLELMEYHTPKFIDKRVSEKVTHQMGNVGHIALKVENIDESFKYIKSNNLAKMINEDPNYKPYKIDLISPSDFHFYHKEKESNIAEKKAVCDIVGSIRYFYFIDNYGIQWELEQGHTDIGE